MTNAGAIMTWEVEYYFFDTVYCGTCMLALGVYIQVFDTRAYDIPGCSVFEQILFATQLPDCFYTERMYASIQK